MHEFPEAQAMVRQACARAGEGAKIRRLTIAVGEASGHDPRHIQEHFAEASRTTAAEGAELEFESVKLTAECAACGKVFEGDKVSLRCDKCGGYEMVITGGKDVRLVRVET